MLGSRRECGELRARFGYCDQHRIEEKGARTALVVTRGTRDVYRIGRQNRPEAYNFFFKRPVPLVPRSHTFEVDERLSAWGEVLPGRDPDARWPTGFFDGRAVVEWELARQRRDVFLQAIRTGEPGAKLTSFHLPN
jgi:hypothetical protein